MPLASDKVLNYGSTSAHIQHVPYSDMLAAIERGLTEALISTGVRKAVQIPDGACCRIKVDLLQAQAFMTAGGTVRANLVLRVSVDGTDFSKTFQGDAHHRKLAGSWRSWQETFDMCLKEATADLVKAVVAEPQLTKLLSSAALP
jgi:hypothetical protein